MVELLTLAPVLADADWAEIVKQGGLASVILLLALFLKWLVAGRFRLEREVLAERDGRLAAEARADKAEAKLERLQEVMVGDFSPALLRNSATGEKLVDTVEKVTEKLDRVLDAFLRLVSKP